MQAKRRYELTDAQWARLEPLLPPEKPWTGRPNDAHRQILKGSLWVLNSGAPWRNLPRHYGPVGPVSSRFYRWRRSGVWHRVLEELQALADAEDGSAGNCTCWTARSCAPTSTLPGRARRVVNPAPGMRRSAARAAASRPRSMCAARATASRSRSP